MMFVSLLFGFSLFFSARSQFSFCHATSHLHPYYPNPPSCRSINFKLNFFHGISYTRGYMNVYLVAQQCRKIMYVCNVINRKFMNCIFLGKWCWLHASITSYNLPTPSFHSHRFFEGKIHLKNINNMPAAERIDCQKSSEKKIEAA